MPAPDLSGDIRRKISLDPPRYRGVLHSWCIPLSVIAGIVATLAAPPVLPRLLVGVYALTLVFMFSFSALFHRLQWSDNGWWKMRQLDHTGIYLVIAGSFTGIAGLTLDGGARAGLLIAVWAVATAGVTYRWLPVVPPFGLTTGLFVLVAALMVPFLGRVGSAIGAGGVALLLIGCGIYFVGGLALGARVPDLWPKVFGYHEVWHVLVVIAAALHFVVVLGFAIPAVQS